MMMNLYKLLIIAVVLFSGGGCKSSDKSGDSAVKEVTSEVPNLPTRHVMSANLAINPDDLKGLVDWGYVDGKSCFMMYSTTAASGEKAFYVDAFSQPCSAETSAPYLSEATLATRFLHERYILNMFQNDKKNCILYNASRGKQCSISVEYPLTHCDGSGLEKIANTATGITFDLVYCKVKINAQHAITELKK
jgi:hypothetical protein